MSAWVGHRRSLAIATLLVAGLVLSGNAEGQAQTKKAVKNAQIITELESVNAELRKANHDYKGHRVKAIHEVNHALKALGVKKPNPGTGKKGGKEDQKFSNAQLRASQVELRAILTRLGKPLPKTGRARAANHIRKAITQLETALKVVGD